MSEQGRDQLSREQLGHLQDELTAGDAWRIQQAGPELRREATMRALHRSAQRLGYAGPDEDLETFLDRIRLEDLNEVLGARRDSKSTGGEGSPRSADIGA